MRGPKKQEDRDQLVSVTTSISCRILSLLIPEPIGKMLIIGIGRKFKFFTHFNFAFFRIEKDCTSWAHDRIKALFTTCPDLPTDFSVTNVTKVEGDVCVNQRKGRVKQLFDLEISFEYKLASGETGTGFISEFTADYEDPTDLCVKLSPKLESKDQRDLIVKAIGMLAEEFKKELYEVHGKPLLLEVGGFENTASSSEPRTAETTSTTINYASSGVTAASGASFMPTPVTASNTCSIEDALTFPCPPEQLYLMLTDSSRIRSWSRAPVTPQILLPQAPFTLFDGNICGKFLTLKSPTQIEMEWKLKSWAKASNVSIEIKESGSGGSCLSIKQTGVPSGEAETVKNNWHTYYWNPIKRAFGVML